MDSFQLEQSQIEKIVDAIVQRLQARKNKVHRMSAVELNQVLPLSVYVECGALTFHHVSLSHLQQIADGCASSFLWQTLNTAWTYGVNVTLEIAPNILSNVPVAPLAALPVNWVCGAKNVTLNAEKVIAYQNVALLSQQDILLLRPNAIVTALAKDELIARNITFIKTDAK
ncbi:MAG: PduM family microcompartment protein [Vibrio sp.]